MGYRFTIGEADLLYDAESHTLGITAAPCTTLSGPGDGTNSRAFGYTEWHRLIEAAGISELFYGQGWNSRRAEYENCSFKFHRREPLLKSHPGYAVPMPADLDYLQAARLRFLDESAEKPSIEMDVLALLDWLCVWFEQALRIAIRPVFVNVQEVVDCRA